MKFDDAMVKAAKAADKAVANTIAKYNNGGVFDEPEISSYLIGQIDAEMRGDIGALRWSSSILRNVKGKKGEESRIGADMLLHVSLDTPTESYSKGLLIQAKKSEPRNLATTAILNELSNQCQKMLSYSPSSFVMSYSTGGFRVGSATRFTGTQNRDIHRVCTWTSYRLFLEFFRCPVGDSRISSSTVADLPVPRIILLSATGDLRE